MQSHHDRVLGRYQALEDQLTKSERLLFDLRNSHEALQEDYHVKTIAMTYSDKCLLVAAEADEDPRTVQFRKQLCERAIRSEISMIELSCATLWELRKRFRAAASEGPDKQPNWNTLWERFRNNRDISELTEDDLKTALRKEFKIGRELLSDGAMPTFFDILSQNSESEEVTIDDLRAFVENDPPTRTVDEFDIPQVVDVKGNILAAQTQRRPPRSIVPLLNHAKIAFLKKRFRGAAWMATTNQGAEQAGELRSIFAKYDKDGEGKLDDLEVRKALRTGLKIPKEVLSDLELWSLIHEIDANNSGKISAKEFVKWCEDDNR